MDWRHQLEILTAGNQVYSELKNLCVWVKSNAGMGSLYRSQHELVFVFKHGKSAHRNNIQLGQFGRYRTNVWNYPSISAFGRQGEEGNLQSLHPTVKPVARVADAILDCSARGDIVLDPFVGSGYDTDRCRANRTGVARAIEIDPLYVDTTHSPLATAHPQESTPFMPSAESASTISQLNAWRRSMDDNERLSHEVGYKKPPRAKQFQKGQSGNPRGRPKWAH